MMEYTYFKRIQTYDEWFRGFDGMLDGVTAVGFSNADNTFICDQFNNPSCCSILNAHAPAQGRFHWDSNRSDFNINDTHLDSFRDVHGRNAEWYYQVRPYR